MELADGPLCSNGLQLWEVRTGNGLQGWIAEGDASDLNLKTLPTYPYCQNTPLSHLKVGDKASISFFPRLSNALREKPGTDANSPKIGNLPPGTIVEVFKGPECNDRYVWWKVKTSDGQKGWTAEGDNQNYWLIPYRK